MGCFSQFGGWKVGERRAVKDSDVEHVPVEDMWAHTSVGVLSYLTV